MRKSHVKQVLCTNPWPCPTNGIVYARLWINNDSRFHINVKVIPLFFVGHAPVLASWAGKPHGFPMSFLNIIMIIINYTRNSVTWIKFWRNFFKVTFHNGSLQESNKIVHKCLIKILYRSWNNPVVSVSYYHFLVLGM